MTRIVFFGTPEPAAKGLRALVGAGHEVVAVYTRPDRIAGRSRQARPTPVKVTALELGIPVHTPGNLRGSGAPDELAAIAADIFVVLAYGRILPPAVLDLPRLGVLNVHPSLLPLYRGPSPVVTAIRDGASATGVSVMLLDEGMDTGPVIAQSAQVSITEADTANSLTDRLFELGVELLVQTIPAWEQGTVHATPQDDRAATLTYLVKKADGELDFGDVAVKLARAIRAYDPWPGTFTRWGGKLLKILEASVLCPESDVLMGSGVPGAVTITDGRMSIATREGSLEIRRLQLEGRNPVSTAEFLHGYPSIEGARLPD